MQELPTAEPKLKEYLKTPCEENHSAHFGRNPPRSHCLPAFQMILPPEPRLHNNTMQHYSYFRLPEEHFGGAAWRGEVCNSEKREWAN